MTSPERDSLLAVAVLVITYVTQRRYLLSMSSVLSYFFIAYWMSGFIGILLLPWALDGVFLSKQLEEGFAFINWHRITDADISTTILLYVGGSLFVLLGFRGSRFVRKLPTAPVEDVRRELNVDRLVALVVASLCFVTFHVLLHPEIFLAGVQSQLLAENKENLNAFRSASASSYPFVLIAFNILPFLSTAVWLHARGRGGVVFRTFSFVAVGASIVTFLLTFLKLSLAIFLIGLATTEVARARRASPSGGRTRVVRIALVLSGGLVLFGVFQGLMRGGTAQTAPFEVTIREILGRVSLSAPAFVHFFPNIEPHYGLSGVGMFSLLTGEPVYKFTAVVFQHMSDMTVGSSTVSSIVEFYCSFGWIGWVLGNVAVGVLLQELDRTIHHIPAGDARLMAQIFAFVYCVQLSQSSIFNASFGYGGLFFFVLWLLIYPRASVGSVRDVARAGALTELKAPLAEPP